MSYGEYLQDLPVSMGYRKNEYTYMEDRMRAANDFLGYLEFGYLPVNRMATFDAVENVLKSKVLTYAIAFASGATYGGMLYQNARRDLKTWRTIYEGATFVNGNLV